MHAPPPWSRVAYGDSAPLYSRSARYVMRQVPNRARRCLPASARWASRACHGHRRCSSGVRGWACCAAAAATPAQSAEWPDVSDAALLASLEDWLAPWLDGVTRRDHLARVKLHDALHALLDWNQQRRLDEQVPTHLTVPSGSRIAVDYSGAMPALAVKLQEVFGWMESPRIAGGRVPVTLELLSPARRPVQVTRDLASFWSRGYAEVRKELKGRYPKHYWPDDPYAATPTRKISPPGERDRGR